MQLIKESVWYGTQTKFAYILRVSWNSNRTRRTNAWRETKPIRASVMINVRINAKHHSMVLLLTYKYDTDWAIPCGFLWFPLSTQVMDNFVGMNRYDRLFWLKTIEWLAFSVCVCANEPSALRSRNGKKHSPIEVKWNPVSCSTYQTYEISHVLYWDWPIAMQFSGNVARQ